MGFEIIERENIRYAEIIRRDVNVNETTFFSPAESSMQFGLLAHPAGYVEDPHHHRRVPRQIEDVQQMVVVQSGVIVVGFYDDSGQKFKEVTLHQGDAIVLVHGAHDIKVVEDMQCVTVKQGPFMGIEFDKLLLSNDSVR